MRNTILRGLRLGLDDYHVGGGLRLTGNMTRYLAGEVEVTRQPTGNQYYGNEWHSALMAKGTYRAEHRRWLRFAGLNFFGVAGLLLSTAPSSSPIPNRLRS